jgi:hypothetical protein
MIVGKLDNGPNRSSKVMVCDKCGGQRKLTAFIPESRQACD